MKQQKVKQSIDLVYLDAHWNIFCFLSQSDDYCGSFQQKFFAFQKIIFSLLRLFRKITHNFLRKIYFCS